MMFIQEIKQNEDLFVFEMKLIGFPQKRNLSVFSFPHISRQSETSDKQKNTQINTQHTNELVFILFSH